MFFFKSLTFQFHTRMLSSEVAQSGSLSVTAMLDFSGEANTSIHGLEEDDTASRQTGV